MHVFPSTIDELFALYESRGARTDCVPGVTELSHARQTAAAAAEDGDDAAIVAAFFHDAGRLLNPSGAAGTEAVRGPRHETAGADVLARFFPAAISEPVRLHVVAKRALCVMEPDYLASLPATYRKALKEGPGGLMNKASLERFLALRHAPAALLLRRCDDRSRSPRAAGLPLADVVAVAERLAVPLRGRG